MPTWNDTKRGYAAMWSAATLRPTWRARATSALTKIEAGRERYKAVQTATGVPWRFVGVLHHMEGRCNFNTHLHNGDPLTGRTTHVPAGRPVAAPANGIRYDWTESAIDALRLKGLHTIPVDEWTEPRALYEAERYNGFGYFARGVNSAYVWSGTSQYVSGKYVADGQWSASAVSKQIGVAAILLIERELKMSELLKLVPLIERVAPVLAGRLLGPGAAAALQILATVLKTEAEPTAVARKLEAAPTSEATANLIEAEELAGGGQSEAPPVPDGVLVDTGALQVKTLITAGLFALALKLFNDAAAAQSIADALAPIVTGGLAALGGAALNWVTTRLVRTTNEATVKALS